MERLSAGDRTSRLTPSVRPVRLGVKRGDARTIDRLLLDLAGRNTAAAAGGKQRHEDYERDKFGFDEARNEMICPQGRRLAYHHRTEKKGRELYVYQAAAEDCRQCAARRKCCPDLNLKNVYDAACCCALAARALTSSSGISMVRVCITPSIALSINWKIRTDQPITGSTDQRIHRRPHGPTGTVVVQGCSCRPVLSYSA